MNAQFVLLPKLIEWQLEVDNDDEDDDLVGVLVG